MTNEEARKIIKQFRDRQGNSSDDIEAFDMAIKALEQTSWIPVSERVPEEAGVYLVSMYRLGYPQREVDGFVCGRWERFGNDVIAWCEIPEPYKESEDEE